MSNTVSKQPLLSICIPTYNRADYLKEALDNIISNKAFSEEIEIIISDNASTDTTQQIGILYAEKHPNIRYYRNEHNIKDANFKLALERGSGKYLKLSNDTLRYSHESISLILEKIRFSDEKNPLFFYNENPFLKKGEYNITSLDEFINHASYFIGWIAQFGLWKSDLQYLNVSEKYTGLQFAQVAWTLNLLKHHKNTYLLSGQFYYTHEPAKKASYNLFKVQVTNLGIILKDYKIGRVEYEKFKYRQFKHFIIPLIYKYIILKQETGFDLSDYSSTMLNEYKFRPYMYIGILYVKFKSIITQLIKNQT